MKKVIFIITDANTSGFLHKSILPTLKLMYAKQGIKSQIINICIDGFNPLTKGDLISNSFVKSYKHQIKTCDHIHFLSTTRLGGLHPAMEGFFDSLLFDEYLDKDQKINKTTFFHVLHQNRLVCSLSLIYFRLRFMIMPKIFKKYYIYQYDPSVDHKNHKVLILNKIKSKILKHIK